MTDTTDTTADTTGADDVRSIPAWPDCLVEHIDDDVTGGVRVVVGTVHRDHLIVSCESLVSRTALVTARVCLIGEAEATCIANIAQRIEQRDS